MKKLSTLFLTLLFSISMVANVSQLEKDALVKLHESTNGKQWNVKRNLSSSVATWHGVKVENDKVISIHLQNNNLVGEIPTEIVNLKNLQELDLHKNQLSGVIPTNIGKVMELKVLNLAFNRSSGVIPASVCEMTNLKNLELYMSLLSGELPMQIGSLKKLEI